MKYSKKMQEVSIPALAAQLRADPVGVVQFQEMTYHNHILEVCDEAVTQNKHLLLLTGPSGSGKTTTAIKILNELARRGKKVDRISLDNFYKDDKDLPFWSDGFKNYESIDAMDVACFHETIRTLTATGTAQFPLYDFAHSARRTDTFTVHYDEETYLIFEGIHALNPVLCEHLHDDNILRIYVSTHSDFVDAEGEVVLKAKNLRLMRRMLRDYQHRDAPVRETLDLWEYVLRGAQLYIKPFRKFADIHINSAHSYEPALYRDSQLRLLEEYRHDEKYGELVQTLIHAVEPLPSLSAEQIPADSLIREFI